MADIFISYARQDRNRIASLAQALQSEGWTVWWDREFLPGENIESRIGNELAAARCVIVAWSETSIQSNWVVDEAAEGRDRGVLASILIDAVKPPMGFRRFHAADLSTWRGQEDEKLGKFLSDVRAILTLTNSPGANPTFSRENVREASSPEGAPKRNRRLAFISSAAAVLLCAIYLYQHLNLQQRQQIDSERHSSPATASREPITLTHGSPVWSLTALRDGRLASGSDNGDIKLWVKDGKAPPTILAHGSPVWSLVALPDGRLASGGDNGEIKLWPTNGNSEAVVLAHGSSVLSLTTLRDGRLVSGGAEGDIKIWPKDGTGGPVVIARDSSVTALVALTNGQLASGGLDARIKLWSEDEKGEPTVLAHGSAVRSLAVLADGRLVSGGDSGEIRLWPKDGKGQPSVLTQTSPVWSLAALPDGRLASGGANGEIRLWLKEGGDPVVFAQSSSVRSLAVLTDGWLASGGANGEVKLWAR